MRWLALVSVSILVVGCSKPAPSNRADMAPDAAAPQRFALRAPVAARVGEAKKPRPDPLPATTPILSMLAYSYGYSLEAPSAGVRALEARHEAACRGAGPASCQVTASNIQSAGADSVEATLSLRAAPAWLDQFRASIAKDATSAGGRVVSATVTSEDLAHSIVDEAAAVKAKTALRDRLQTILETRPGKMSDLLDVETALANVQGELDAATSELAQSQERVATSVLTIDYKSSGVLAPDSIWSPLGSAINDIAGSIVGALAVMVRIVTVLLPWGLVVGAGVWVYRRFRPKVARRPFTPGKTPPAEQG
jgi:hypothetical protein